MLIPKLVDENTKIFGKAVESDWESRFGRDDHVTFIIFLPGYTEGVSQWTHGNILGYDGHDVKDAESAKNAKILFNNNKNTKKTVYREGEGLYITLEQSFDDAAASASVTINYWPNKSVTDKKVTQTLYRDQ